MVGRQLRYFSGADILRGTIIHHDMENAGDVVLKVGSFAAVGLRYRFYVLRPPPTGFELGSAYRASAHFYKLDLSILELANLVGRIEMLNFHLIRRHRPAAPVPYYKTC